jgi:hypothetical protein
MTQREDLIVKATRIAHQAALNEHFRIKKDLAKMGVTADDFGFMDRFTYADLGLALQRARDV